MNALFSPISWLIFFSSRSNIPNFMSFILVLKIALMSITAYYTFNKLFVKTDRKFKLLFSVLYALSGYTLLMYSNIIWLDNLILFPLLVLSLKQLFDKKRSKLFVTVLTLSLIFSFYISYMFLIFIIITSILGFIFHETNDKKVIACKLLLYIFISLCMASFSVIPAVMQSLNSYRLSIASINNNYTLEKIIYLFPSALAIILFIKQMFNYKKDKKATLFYLLLFLLTVIGIIIEPINKMWHTGSYNSFPFRYGFIPIFVLILTSLHYLNNNKVIFKIKVNRYLLITSFILLNLLLLYIILAFKDTILLSNIVLNFEYLKQFVGLLIIFIVILFITLLSLINNNKESIYMLNIISIISIITFGFFAINFNTTITSKTTSDMQKRFVLDTSSIYRYKDNTLSLNPNYSYALNVSTIGNWMHIISKNQVLTHSQLGYIRDDTTLYSTGGTIFSDYINGNKYTFSYHKLPSNLYKLLDEEDGIYYYESKYNSSFVIPYIGNDYINLEENLFNYQNHIYQSIFNKIDNIIDITDPKIIKNNVSINDNTYFSTNKDAYIKFNINLNSNSYVYLNLDIEQYLVSNITVDGKSISNPILDNKQNTSYPASDQNMICLGNYDKGIIEVNIPIDYVKINNIKVGTIDTKKFISLASNNEEISVIKDNRKGVISINYDNKEEYNSLLIPINYLKGYTILNNDKKVDYTNNINNFISINLNDGENRILIKYNFPYFNIFLIFSTISVVIYSMFSYLDTRFGIAKNKVIKNIFSFVYIILGSILLLKIYIISFF